VREKKGECYIASGSLLLRLALAADDEAPPTLLSAAPTRRLERSRPVDEALALLKLDHQEARVAKVRRIVHEPVRRVHIYFVPQLAHRHVAVGHAEREPSARDVDGHISFEGDAVGERHQNLQPLRVLPPPSSRVAVEDAARKRVGVPKRWRQAGGRRAEGVRSAAARTRGTV